MTSQTTAFPVHDVQIVRRLAARVVELARSDEYEKRRRRWRDANCGRRPDRAPVWCRPAGCWREVLPPESLECTDPFCRRVETVFRQHLYKDWVGDDHIVEPWWGAEAIFKWDQEFIWGLPTGHSLGTTAQGGFRYHHPIETPEDYEKIAVANCAYDPVATQRAAGQIQDLLGDTMPVRITGVPPLGPLQGTYLEQLRGMMGIMEDLALCPHSVHRAMAKLTEGILRALRVAEAAGILTPNHHEPMTCSDPLNDPPANGPVKLHHLWTSANSQEFDQISPAMQEEYLLSYQKVVFQQFGGVQYGCCENLTAKIPIVLQIPNLRIFVCSFWSDLDRILEACGRNYTIMWRQSATQVTVNSTLDEHRAHIESGLKRLQGHFYQIVLRELETLNGRPDRLREWARLAIGLAEKYA